MARVSNAVPAKQDEDLKQLVVSFQEKQQEEDAQQQFEGKQLHMESDDREEENIRSPEPVKKEVLKVSLPSPYTSVAHCAMAQSATVVSGGKPVPLLPVPSPSKKERNDIWSDIVNFESRKEQEEKVRKKKELLSPFGGKGLRKEGPSPSISFSPVLPFCHSESRKAEREREDGAVDRRTKKPNRL